MYKVIVTNAIPIYCLSFDSFSFFIDSSFITPTRTTAARLNRPGGTRQSTPDASALDESDDESELGSEASGIISKLLTTVKLIEHFWLCFTADASFDPELYTLPQLTPNLRAAQKDGVLRLKLNYNEFIRLMADHLKNINFSPSKAVYNHYSRMVVDKYKDLKDKRPDGKSYWVIKRVYWGYVIDIINIRLLFSSYYYQHSVQHKIVKRVGNSKDYNKHKENRKLRRVAAARELFQQQAALAAPDATDEDAVDGDQQQDAPAVGGGPLDAEGLDRAAVDEQVRLHEEFEARRRKMKRCKTLDAILKEVPDYFHCDKVRSFIMVCLLRLKQK